MAQKSTTKTKGFCAAALWPVAQHSHVRLSMWPKWRDAVVMLIHVVTQHVASTMSPHVVVWWRTKVGQEAGVKKINHMTQLMQR